MIWWGRTEWGDKRQPAAVDWSRSTLRSSSSLTAGVRTVRQRFGPYRLKRMTAS